MLKNKSLTLIFFCLSLSFCGLNTGGKNLAQLTASKTQDQYFRNTDGSLEGFLSRNQDFRKSQYSKLILYIKIPFGDYGNASALPDFTTAIRIQEINLGPHIYNVETQTLSVDTEDVVEDAGDSDKTVLKTAIFTLGDLKKGDEFLTTQNKERDFHLAISNISWNSEEWVYDSKYTPYIKDHLSLPLNQFVYSIQNSYGGCVSQCYGSTAIIPSFSQSNRTLSYSLTFWLFDSGSSISTIDRSHTILSIESGYINNQGFFQPIQNVLPMIVDFSISETEVDYKNRIQKKKEADQTLSKKTDKETSMSKFFSKFTPQSNQS